jgi:hypothetical protein
MGCSNPLSRNPRASIGGRGVSGRAKAQPNRAVGSPASPLDSGKFRAAKNNKKTTSIGRVESRHCLFDSPNGRSGRSVVLSGREKQARTNRAMSLGVHPFSLVSPSSPVFPSFSSPPSSSPITTPYSPLHSFYPPSRAGISFTLSAVRRAIHSFL